MLLSTALLSLTPTSLSSAFKTGFTQGFAFVIESASDIRVRFECLHHKKETRNSRKIEEKDRKRVETHIRGTGCPFALYISRQKRRGDQWILCYTKHTEHNHPPSPDPFQLLPHRRRRPGHREVLRLAATHRDTIGYADSSEILGKMGLELDRKSFYNLQRKESEGQLSSQEQARLLLDYLQHAGFHFEVDEVFTFNAAGDRERIILTIAWFSPEQIRLDDLFLGD